MSDVDAPHPNKRRNTVIRGKRRLHHQASCICAVDDDGGLGGSNTIFNNDNNGVDSAFPFVTRMYDKYGSGQGLLPRLRDATT